MTKLSVNINKIATIRNARGGMIPNVVEAAINIEKYGAHGITVHPRPDGRHIRYSDVIDLSKVLTTEFNIEGYPQQDFLDLCFMVKPHQVTLVPDPPDVLTSNAGWDTVKHGAFLSEVVSALKAQGMRVSLFVAADSNMIENAVATGCDRVELYTESYAAGSGAVSERAHSERGAIGGGVIVNRRPVDSTGRDARSRCSVCGGS